MKIHVLKIGGLTLGNQWLNLRFIHLGLSFGINFTVLSLLGGWGGRALDQRWETAPWLLITGITGGIMLAFYALIKEILALDKIRVSDEAEQKNQKEK
jgi:F0F1-type ATP synthase assembly protein I